ncbi:MAG: glutamate--tRNA ligase [Actinobacteria bacterium]|nr:glutamate--tRNA ligase [Actinomycetota bacterium]
MTDVASPRFRFAPSPTGFFHVGGARTALYNWALAKRLGGTFVLRIEDTDEARNKPEWTQGIIDALDWIGVRRDDPTFEGNGSPMFLLANVVDDVSMRVSHVVRAEEHLPNTPKQQMLWEALGHRPPVWAHVPVLVNEQRKKLSKRRDKVALEQFRDEGYLSEAMVNYLMTLGWAPHGDEEIVPWSRIQAEFRLEDVNHSPAYFDLKKLAAFNGEYIRAMSLDDFVAACEPFLTTNVPWSPDQFDVVIFRSIAPLAQTRMVTMNEIVALVDFLFLDEPMVDETAWSKTFGNDEARAMLDDAISSFGSVTNWSAEVLKQTLEDAGTARGLKLGKAQAPVRVAVTGRTVGPPLFEALELLGPDKTLARLRAAAERAR